MTPENPEQPDDKTPKPSNGKASGHTPATPKDFLHAGSMLTPGICGGITMLITNALVAQFGAPANYTGLIISCLLGLIVFAATTAVWWIRVIYWMLNSLIIFSIALGSNQIGVATSKRSSTVSLPFDQMHLYLSANASKPNEHFTVSLPVKWADLDWTVASLWPKKPFFANWFGNKPDENEKIMTVNTTANDFPFPEHGSAGLWLSSTNMDSWQWLTNVMTRLNTNKITTKTNHMMP